MASTFYRIYRPKKFSELVGQEEIRKILEKSLVEDRPGHAYLFTGPRGTGKTTTARIFAKALNCLLPLRERDGAEPCGKCSNCQLIDKGQTTDLVEIDAASYTGVDNIRQLTENINLAPANLNYRIFIIDEVHMLSKGAFNALLKTLEEPPSHAVFILATTEFTKVPATVASRCQKYFFRLFRPEEIVGKLKKIARQEQIEIEDESLKLIAEAAEGGMRDAESIFAQVASVGDKKITSEAVRSVLRISGSEEENILLENLLKKDIIASLSGFDELVKTGAEPFMLSHRMLNKLRKILLLKINPEGKNLLIAESEASKMQSITKLANKINISEISNLMMKIIQNQPLIKNSSLPFLPLELLIIDYCKTGMDSSNVPSNASSVGELPKENSEKKNQESAKVNKKSKEPLRTEEDKIPNEIFNEKLDQKHSKINSEKEEKELLSEKRNDNFDIKAVLESWPKILEKMKDLQPALLSILRVCSPVKIENETLIISTPFKFHQERLNEAKNRALFCAELKTATGIERICVLEDKAVKAEPKKEDELVDQVKNLLNL